VLSARTAQAFSPLLLNGAPRCPDHPRLCHRVPGRRHPPLPGPTSPGGGPPGLPANTARRVARNGLSSRNTSITQGRTRQLRAPLRHPLRARTCLHPLSHAPSRPCHDRSSRPDQHRPHCTTPASRDRRLARRTRRHRPHPPIPTRQARRRTTTRTARPNQPRHASHSHLKVRKGGLSAFTKRWSASNAIARHVRRVRLGCDFSQAMPGEAVRRSTAAGWRLARRTPGAPVSPTRVLGSSGAESSAKGPSLFIRICGS
jgi:hypothetical protein